MIEEQCRESRIVCCGEEITGTKVTNLETVLGLSLDEYIGLRDNYFFLLYSAIHIK
jgi:hypothetical protein